MMPNNNLLAALTTPVRTETGENCESSHSVVRVGVRSNVREAPQNPWLALQATVTCETGTRLGKTWSSGQFFEGHVIGGHS